MGYPKLRGIAKLIDFSYTDKNTEERVPRYYLYLKTPRMIEDKDFPFKMKEELFCYIENGKLIVEKM